MSEVGKRIQELLAKEGLSQKDLALKIEVEPVTISRYIKGVREPNIETLVKLANVLHTSVDDLIGYDLSDARAKSYLEIKKTIMLQAKNMTASERRELINILLLEDNSEQQGENKMEKTTKNLVQEMIENNVYMFVQGEEATKFLLNKVYEQIVQSQLPVEKQQQELLAWEKASKEILPFDVIEKDVANYLYNVDESNYSNENLFTMNMEIILQLKQLQLGMSLEEYEESRDESRYKEFSREERARAFHYENVIKAFIRNIGATDSEVFVPLVDLSLTLEPEIYQEILECKKN